MRSRSQIGCRARNAGKTCAYKYMYALATGDVTRKWPGARAGESAAACRPLQRREAAVARPGRFGDVDDGGASSTTATTKYYYYHNKRDIHRRERDDRRPPLSLEPLEPPTDPFRVLCTVLCCGPGDKATLPSYATIPKLLSASFTVLAVWLLLPGVATGLSASCPSCLVALPSLAEALRTTCSLAATASQYEIPALLLASPWTHRPAFIYIKHHACRIFCGSHSNPLPSPLHDRNDYRPPRTPTVDAVFLIARLLYHRYLVASATLEWLADYELPSLPTPDTLTTMTQQNPHDMGYLDYNTSTSRSPNSSRPNYGGAGGFNAGMSLPRQAQRPFDAPLGSSALYPAERLVGGYNPRGIDTMSASGMPGYMLDNGQAWNYNTSGVATVNGAVNGGNRQRGVNRRAALPQNWTDHSGMGMHGGLQPYSGGLNGNHMSNGDLRGVSHSASHGSPTDLRSAASDAEQLIPTAIVIKNIPFAVRKETLASIMMDMHLPQPYAFNYHFDNGVFRGLAFANFQSAEDTRMVIDAMNGMDVHGRKLRVEYKKMLPEAERERIEREKRERRGQLEEQHRAPMLHQQASIQSLGALSQTHARPSSQLSTPHLGDVDLNDGQTLEFYTELVMFRRDDSREILVFPPGIAPEHRRSIHILAHHMGLEHQSIGEADTRQLTVLKRTQPSPTTNAHNQPANSLDMHKRGLSRAATFDFADRDTRGASSTYSHAPGRQGPMLEVPGSPDSGIPNNLRAAKSFADLRSFTPSPSQASSSYMAPVSGMGNMGPGSTARFGDYMGGGMPQPIHPGSSGTPKNDSALLNSLSSLNLGPYDSNTMQNQSRNTPGAIGSQRPGANGSSKGAPERQPRGPEWENVGGFGGRRTNGHVQRGSGM
ncbi:hypothetical protein G7046_g779 [Stylonectria norvegica]|nr:hypothetical protein G7046_g779 [Stylonectria norvegica]